MDCQLKRDVNPFVVACFLVSNQREFSFAKQKSLRNINYFANVYFCNYYYGLRTSHQGLITLIIMNVLT